MKTEPEESEEEVDEEKEVELDEASLEELTASSDEGMGDADTFSEFMLPGTGDRIETPTLDSAPVNDAPVEDIEEDLKDVPTPASAGTEDEDVYNLPDYGVGYDSAQLEEARTMDRQMNVTATRVRQAATDDFRKIDFGAWHRDMVMEGEGGGRGGTDAEYQVEMKRASEADGLPFEDREDRKYLN